MTGRASVLAIAAALSSACIIPDTHIRPRGDFPNPGAVRIVQATPLSKEANEACGDVDVKYQGGCPVLPPSVAFGLLGEDAPLCVCPNGDANALHSFDIYVEDEDVDDQGRAIDTLFGAFLLDLPSDADDPSQYHAYQNLLTGEEPATAVQLGFGGYTDAIERPTPLVRSWTLGRDTPIDLCNDNAGTPLELGLHSLRLVVTDRPWYLPVELDDKGQAQYDKDDALVRVNDAEALIGVPDTPAGASYAIANYVFRCGDGSDVDNPDNCNCNAL